MEKGDDTLASENNQGMTGFVAEPKGVHIAVSATGKVVVSIMQTFQQSLGTEVLVWQQVDEQLSAPAAARTLLRRFADRRMLAPASAIPAAAAEVIYDWYRAGFVVPASDGT